MEFKDPIYCFDCGKCINNSLRHKSGERICCEVLLSGKRNIIRWEADWSMVCTEYKEEANE